LDKRKRAKLKAAGWTVGTTGEFLRLSDEEAAFVEFKLALSKTLQALRTAQELSQVDVARRLQSSQSRVAKMEASDPSVSVDLLVKSLFKLGAQPGDIAKALRPRRKVPAV
jgi:predicted XRE-type DNA-binding protein